MNRISEAFIENLPVLYSLVYSSVGSCFLGGKCLSRSNYAFSFCAFSDPADGRPTSLTPDEMKIDKHSYWHHHDDHSQTDQHTHDHHDDPDHHKNAAGEVSGGPNPELLAVDGTDTDGHRVPHNNSTLQQSEVEHIVRDVIHANFREASLPELCNHF